MTPEEQAVHDMVQEIGHRIRKCCDGIGAAFEDGAPEYALTVFRPGEEGWLSYVTSADLLDAIEATRQQLLILENQLPKGDLN